MVTIEEEEHITEAAAAALSSRQRITKHGESETEVMIGDR